MTPAGTSEPHLSVRWVLREGARRLAAAGMAHAQHETEQVLGRLLSAPRLELYLDEAGVAPVMAERFFAQIDARASGTPLQYLLEEADFYGASLTIAPGVFIPRPETEVIVEAALPLLRARALQLARPLRLLDAGTGSGCIAVTLARALPACLLVAVELSWNALQAARRNVQRHELASRIHLVQGRWVDSIRGAFDGIISNPPYVPSAQVDHLPLDVRREPRLSLDGGPDGTQALRHLLAEAPRVLHPGGVVVLECGEDQAGALVEHARTCAWVATAQILHDLADRPRGVLLQRRSG